MAKCWLIYLAAGPRDYRFCIRLYKYPEPLDNYIVLKVILPIYRVNQT